MKKIIESLGEHANRLETDLYREVIKLDNHMNECECRFDGVKYDFSNTIGHHEIHVFCLNCGGYVEPDKIGGL